jgi:hypothetical protein
MGNHVARAVLCLATIAGCGDKPPPKPPVVKDESPPPPPPKQETEEDREARRAAARRELVPEGTSCLPVALKQPSSFRLDLAAAGKDALICAVDIDPERLLGPIACWKVENLADGKLAYEEPRPLPGRSIPVKLDGRCARGMCLPDETKLPDDQIVQLSWNEEGSKAALVAEDDVHVFDSATRQHETQFSIRGDKGVGNDPSAVHWIGETIFVEGADAGPAAYVWAFKLDGTPLGPLTALGVKKETMLSTYGGAFVILDKERVAVAEQGYTTVTTYEAATGKRTKILRKVTRGPCKQAEYDAYWTDGEVPEKCQAHMLKTFGHLIGADAVAGRTNLLVLLRGPRLGELAVLDVRNLKETSSFKLPWCDGTATDE